MSKKHEKKTDNGEDQEQSKQKKTLDNQLAGGNESWTHRVRMEEKWRQRHRVRGRYDVS